jgi:hypothetical protein
MSGFFQLLGLMVVCGTVLAGGFMWALNSPEGKMRDCCVWVFGWAFALLCAVYCISPVDFFPIAVLPVDDTVAFFAGLKAAHEAWMAGTRQAVRRAAA